MKNRVVIFVLFLFFQLSMAFSANWTNQSIYNYKVFVENVGQFSHNENALADPIHYFANVDGVQIYFTKKGLSYRYDELVKINTPGVKSRQPNGEEKEQSYNTIAHVLHMDWKGANPNVEIISENITSFYFTYGEIEDFTGKKCYKASAFKKIIYKNIYPNIDIEYVFLENAHGIKYNIILHPGANPSLIKMDYQGAENIFFNKGDLQIITLFGNIVDHAPVAYYDEGRSPIASFFELNNSVVSFHLSNYDTSKTIVIDPWTTVPTFTAYNSAYDVEYDFAGNVYVYGGQGQTAATAFQVIKLNNTGVIQWVYSAVALSPSVRSYYGDIAVDASSGTSYLVEGYASNGSAKVIKVNSAGVQIAVFFGDWRLEEMWRIEFNNCTKKAVIAGGGTSFTYQAALLDTTLAGITPINVLSTTGIPHDFSLLATDNQNNFYMATNKSVADPAQFDNVMIKGPVNAALLPLSYTVPTNYTFIETSSLFYVAGGVAANNGFNGMAVNGNNLYTYDGSVLKKWNKNTGAFINSVTLSTVPFIWSGITVDDCDNIFVGMQKSVIQLDGSLNTINVIAVTDTVYDVILAPGNILNVCGKRFVSSVASGVTCSPANFNVSISTSGSGCIASSATANVTGGTPNYSYSWSPGGATGSTISNLSAGTYTVTVSDNACNIASATVTIGASVIAATISAIQPGCLNNFGSATVTASGGTPGYTYSWAPSGGSGATASGLSPGTYTVTVTDNTNCTQTATVTINTISNTLAVTTTATPAICTNANGTATANVTGGTPAYNYAWSPSGGSNQTATGLAGGTYTVTVTDLNGCTQTATITVNVSAGTLVVTTSTTPSICLNANGTATASTSGGTAGYSYVWSPSGGTNSTASGLNGGTYTVTVTDVNGCTQTATATVNTSSGTLAVTTTSTPAICTNTNGTATANVSGGTAAYSYVWTPSGGTNSTASGLSGGTYTVTVTDGNGCTQTSSIVITTTAGPTASVSSNVTIQPGNSTTLNATGGGSYLWTPATGLSCTNCQSPVASPLQTTTYCVIVTDNNGCSDTACVTISVETPCPTNEDIQVPNAFSPNNDGVNDEFCLQGWDICVESFTIFIYDRWGEKVFESIDPNFCWDGKYSNKPMDAQVFVYAINASFLNKDKKIQKKGNISLIR